ncbi:hypothetical protein B0H21DRAFT_746523 [Amylocystis lapponica]|nr:hypothetical protein B0H21DRAFT_746523 [Amylocystis lapponica]
MQLLLSSICMILFLPLQVVLFPHLDSSTPPSLHLLSLNKVVPIHGICVHSCTCLPSFKSPLFTLKPCFRITMRNMTQNNHKSNTVYCC